MGFRVRVVRIYFWHPMPMETVCYLILIYQVYTIHEITEKSFTTTPISDFLFRKEESIILVGLSY